MPSLKVVVRADAARNRDRILAAARLAFDEPDAEVSMAEVARRASVSSATLYRNFANRRELLAALYTHEIDVLCDAAASSERTGRGLMAWLRTFYRYYCSKQRVAADLLQHTDEGDPVFVSGLTRILRAGEPLLLGAQTSGTVRSDLTIRQVVDMVAAIANIPGDQTYRAPVLDAALQGLAPR